MPYPVSVTVEPVLTGRNRLTVAFRLILAIPHLLLVGGIGLGFAVHSGTNDNVSYFGGETGILGFFVYLLAIISWFTIVLTAQHITGIRQFTMFYLRWRVRSLAYLMLLQDAYPPFGDAPYPAALVLTEETGPRNRLTVALRILLLIPHFIVLGLLSLAWWITALISWLIILASGAYPKPLYEFGEGVLRWYIRVEAYLLLLVDTYPPFSFG
jgi:uncharacterized protein DUF4389